MRSIKTILLGTTLAAGFALFFGTTNANAESLYTVQAGDTLSKISQQFVGDNSLVEKIAVKNNIDNANLIYTGEQLSIPTADELVTAPATVQAAPVTPAAAEPVQAQAPAAVEAVAPATTSSAKEWIAQKESSGSYTATNGRYIGRYQLDSSYLNGDYSAANQERVADEYVAGRYGSWEAAQAFWLANGWY